MNNNSIIESSIISVGKYEILYGTGVAASFEEDTPKVIQYLNNAKVRYYDVDLKCDINWKETGKSINSISFLMPRDNAYLGDVFITTPYGLIKKNRTGVGATTLELSSPRNSIVVVPTRALAYNKAINSKIEGEENKYKILYVGGKIAGFNVPAPSAYIADSSIEYKKFIVVVDSFPGLLKDIGEDNYKDYFLMIDEIDSYQYDCSYRPNMEDVIDYYFQFPPTQRCLVSATISSFSNKQIEEEPIINVQFNQPLSRNIKLFYTDDTNIRLKKTIEDIHYNHPNDKILVAYNAIRNCLIVINSLEEVLKNECAMLCSTKNENTIPYYHKIIENQLPKQISFMTCTYFVGIDITERFHLISVINSNKPQTALTTDKLQQIAGRCRHIDEVLSETIIYSTKTPSDDYNLTEISKQVLSDAEQMSLLGNLYPALKLKFPKVLLFRDNLDVEDFIKGSRKSYYGGSKPIQIIRRNSNGLFVPAYFSIDNIRIQIELMKSLYSQKLRLYNELVRLGNNIYFHDYVPEMEHLAPEVERETEEQIHQSNQEQRERLITLLREESTLENRERLANRLKSHCSTSNTIFIERFIELQTYLPFEVLIQKLQLYDTSKEYDSFYNSVMFWALSEGHQFKLAFYQQFPINTLISGNVLTERFNNMWQSSLGYRRLTNRQAIPILRLFCKIKKTSSRVIRTPYIIESYDINDFNCQPIHSIPANVNIRNIFRF
ncbi:MULTISPECIES: hypothetical protein [Bacteroides]|uniref:hypothetical protein n=1 Tax=Bacteroides TaxID=816 RepID=UPI000E4672D1|nr:MULTISPECIES: hypothetical protein [Bacteroides]RHL11466.1 hypothetical protein DW036_04850 [Bacteroides sp. AF39-11AC]